MLFEELLQSQAKGHQINPNWLKAIISQESQWNVWAIRNEMKYQYLQTPEIFAKHPLISLSTEIATQKMSWGLGQIMGGLAREQGHVGFMAELLQPDVNIKHICIRIQTLMKYSHVDQDVFAMYNGGPGAIHKSCGKYMNQDYVNSVMAYLQKFENSSKTI